MLLTSVQEENKENKEDNKDITNENITMTIYKQPYSLLNIQVPVKTHLDKDKNIEMKNGNNYFINNIKNNIKNSNIKNNSKNNSKNNEKKTKHCCCYNKESQDMRCCGLCYTFCYYPDKEDQCYMCPETFEIYYTSGYFITSCGYGDSNEECENCLPTVFCLPVKIALFWPCLFGSLCNNSINYCRSTDANYLF